MKEQFVSKMTDGKPSIRLDVSEHIILIRPQGALTADNLLRVLEHCYELPEFRERRDLWDVRGLETNLDYESMRKVTGFTRGSRGKDWRQDRSAIVVDGDLQLGFARMYEMLTDDLNFRLGIFRSMEEAVAWLLEGR